MCINHSKRAKNHWLITLWIRGKLGRTVALLITHDIVEMINLMLQMRSEAGVSNENPYVFGYNRNQFLIRACALLKNFAVECGAKKPHTLRRTELQKHIATVVQTLN